MTMMLMMMNDYDDEDDDEDADAADDDDRNNPTTPKNRFLIQKSKQKTIKIIRKWSQGDPKWSQN